MTALTALARVVRRAFRERITPAEALRREVAELRAHVLELRYPRRAHHGPLYVVFVTGNGYHCLPLHAEEINDLDTQRAKISTYVRVFAAIQRARTHGRRP